MPQFPSLPEDWLLQVKESHSFLFISFLLLLLKAGLGCLVLKLLQHDALIPKETRGSKILQLIHAEAFMMCHGEAGNRQTNRLLERKIDIQTDGKDGEARSHIGEYKGKHLQRQICTTKRTYRIDIGTQISKASR